MGLGRKRQKGRNDTMTGKGYGAQVDMLLKELESNIPKKELTANYAAPDAGTLPTLPVVARQCTNTSFTHEERLVQSFQAPLDTLVQPQLQPTFACLFTF